MPYYLIHSGWMVLGCMADHRPIIKMMKAPLHQKFSTKLQFSHRSEASKTAKHATAAPLISVNFCGFAGLTPSIS